MMVYSLVQVCSLVLFLTNGFITLNVTIDGPRSLTDKIAIIGAGPAGVHMALLLKNRGFVNIEILEKTNRIGGKAWSINYRGAIHEMGACYLSRDYQDNVIPLVKQYISKNELVPLPASSVWNSSYISFKSFVTEEAKRILGTTHSAKAGLQLLQAINRYIHLHTSLFGKYDGEIMPEPSTAIWSRINGTFLEFLRRNNLEALQPILLALHTVQGYGRLDEISCLYGLMWITPNFMRGMLARLAGNSAEEGNYMIKSGFQTIWENIVKMERLKVKFNVDIKSLYRSKLSGYKDIFIKFSHHSKSSEIHQYDFVIWSPDMSTSLKYWANKEIYDEKFYFSKLKPTYFSTGLVNSVNMIRGSSPIAYYADGIYNKNIKSLWATRNSYATLNGFLGVNYTANLFPNGDDTLSYTTSVTYQMNDEKISDEKLKKTLNLALFQFSTTEVEILYFNTWRYFPRFSPKDIEKGYLWRIIDMQGKYGMWYIGSSVCFESVKSVMEYNKMLVNNIKAPQGVSNTSKGNILLSSNNFVFVFNFFYVYFYLSNA